MIFLIIRKYFLLRIKDKMSGSIEDIKIILDHIVLAGIII